MPFSPQSMFWPGTRAILLVHGIGDASTGKDGAFPIDVTRRILGDESETTAVYRFTTTSSTTGSRPRRSSRLGQGAAEVR